MQVFETDRLTLREFVLDDAPFVRELVNEPGWKKYIGDRGVNSVEDARGYIQRALLDSYAKNGFGLWAVELKEAGELIGMCGLIKRDTLEDVDIGFALLERFEGNGYAREAANATLELAQDRLGIRRIVAITTQDNLRSGSLLERIGMHFEKLIDDGGEQLRLFAIALPPPAEG